VEDTAELATMTLLSTPAETAVQVVEQDSRSLATEQSAMAVHQHQVRVVLADMVVTNQQSIYRLAEAVEHLSQVVMVLILVQLQVAVMARTHTTHG
jgi:hypothetical protein